MKVTVNGKTLEMAENTHLTDLIVSSKVKAEAIIVVLNDVVVRKDLWMKTALKEGDTMELVSLVGGG